MTDRTPTREPRPVQRSVQRPLRRRVAALLPALPVLALLACGSPPPAPDDRGGEPVPVTVASATPQLVTSPIVASGSVEAWRRASPGSKLLGRVAAVPAREGDDVEAGQALARLDGADLAAAVDLAEAGVAAARARLEQASTQHARFERLHARGSATRKSLEDATAEHRLAEAGLAAAEADLDAARIQLGYGTIRAPFSGWVVARRVEAGDLVAPGQPLFTVDEMSRVKVVVEVAESDLGGIAAGDPAEVRVDAAGVSRTATVDRTIPAGDPHSRTFQVQLEVDNADGRIKPGMFARAELRGGAGREALVVPGDAVVTRGQLEGVFVVEAGLARLRWLRLGRTFAGGREVLSGLASGERYVVRPPAALADGSPVEVR